MTIGVLDGCGVVVAKGVVVGSDSPSTIRVGVGEPCAGPHADSIASASTSGAKKPFNSSLTSPGALKGIRGRSSFITVVRAHFENG